MTSHDNDNSAPDDLRTGGGLDVLGGVNAHTDALIGCHIASYRLDSLLAEGGMGRVYLSERRDGQFERQVAIKVLPSGVGSEYVRRFERERVILARLNHPNIAQLYDAGVTDARNPYLVMELVDGMAIDEYCQVRQCSFEQKITLLIDLCDALGFAHSKLVLHRDIKPSNVLVTHKGKVKLLDFGIAKMLEPRTAGTRGASPMTPQYASPEQLIGETLSIASDIYQVGILIHLLFTGKTPFDRSDLATRIRQVSEEKRVPLDDSVYRLPADLQTVLRHCLATNISDRYPDVNSLAADLKRIIDGYPVLIRPPGWIPTVSKWLKRNRLFSLTVGSLATVLVISTGWYTWSLNQTSSVAQRQAMIANQTRDLILDLMKAGDPLVAQGKDITVIEVIDAGLSSIRETEISDPRVRVEIMYTLADVYSSLGAVRKASDLVREAYEYSTTELGPNHDLTWKSANLLASILVTTGNYAEAEKYYGDLQAALDATATHGPLRAELMNDKALLYLRTGRYEKALSQGEAALDYARESVGERSESALVAVSTLSEIYRLSAKPDQAIDLLTAHLPVANEMLGELHRVTIGMTLNLAGAYYIRFGLDRATPLLEEVRAKNLEVLGPNHPDTIRDIIYLGALYGDTGRFERAEALTEDGINRHIRLFGTEHPNSIRYRASMMHLHLQQGQFKEALNMCDELVPLHRRVNGEDHWFTLETRRSCAIALYEAKQREKGAEALRSVLADLRRVFGPEFFYSVGTARYMATNGIPERVTSQD